MKTRYALQERNLNNAYSREWRTIATSPVSPKVAIANYKKSRGRSDYYSLDNLRLKGYEFRMITIVIEETITEIENV